MNRPLEIFVEALTETPRLFLFRDVVLERKRKRRAAEATIALRNLSQGELTLLVERLLLFAATRMEQHTVADELTPHDFVVAIVEDALNGELELDSTALFSDICRGMERLIVEVKSDKFPLRHDARTDRQSPMGWDLIDVRPTLDAILMRLETY